MQVQCMHSSRASCQSYTHTHFPTSTHESVLLLGGLGQSASINGMYTHARAMHIRDVGQQKTSEKESSPPRVGRVCACARARARVCVPPSSHVRVSWVGAEMSVRLGPIPWKPKSTDRQRTQYATRYTWWCQLMLRPR